MWFEVAYFVITLVLTIALAPRPPNAKAATLTDFQLPTAEQGRSIPVIFGTVLITGSNCVWYGDLATVANKVHSLFSSTTVGFYYHLGFQLALGHGPFDSINKIYWDEKLTWQGSSVGGTLTPLTADGNACMYFPDLFGGATGAGGVTGCFNISFGYATNSPNTYLQSVLGTVPNFRGVTCAIWIGGNRSLSDNFTQSNLAIIPQTVRVGYIGTSPSVRGVAFEATRIQQGWNTSGGCWYPTKAVVQSNQAVTAPPTWEPTFADSLLGPIDGTVTHIQFTAPTSGGNSNWQIGVGGYIRIGTEWMRINTLETYVPSGGVYNGQTILNGYMDVTRGVFGTTRGTYSAETAYQVYLTVSTPIQMMNPAHIVYQCLTDPKWGMGLALGQLDDAAFRAAADTFYAEGMGLCMQWVQASTVQDFLKIVLNHCAANLVLLNATGLYQLIPIRGGYNVSTLPTFDESVIVSLDEFSTQAWADEINEVILVYTDPATNKDTAITGQDISNIDVQGKIVSQTVNYQGIKDHVLAAAVLGRELSARCTPLVKLRFKINRSAWGTSIGGLFKLNWADRNVTGMIFRVSQVQSGKLEANTIQIDAVQDIYALGLFNYQVTTSVSPAQPAVFSIPSSASSGGPTVLSASITTPPPNPLDGDRYIVPVGATGAWTGEEGLVAIWDAGLQQWAFVPIPQGVPVYDQATGEFYTTNNTGGLIQSQVGQATTASAVSYDDSSTQLGVANVQKAIEALASQISSSINLQAYANGQWFAETQDGTIFKSTDLISWTPQTYNQTSLNQLIYRSDTATYHALKGNKIGTTPAANLWTTWTYVGAGSTPWQGLRWFPTPAQLVVWEGNIINVSTGASDGATWSNPSTAADYATVVAADAPVFWARLGDDHNSLTWNSGSGPFNVTGGFGGFTQTSRMVGGLLAGSADALDTTFDPVAVYYSDPSTVPEAITGTGPFSVEYWVQSSTVPTVRATLFTKMCAHPDGTNSEDLVLLTWDPIFNSSKITFQTNHISGPGAPTVGMQLTTAAGYALNDGGVHHIVATRDGAGGAAIYLDGVQVAVGTGLPVDDITATNVVGNYLPVGEQFNNLAGESVLDECAIYTTSLSSVRVLAHFHAGTAGLRGAVSIVDIEYDSANSRYLVFLNLAGVSAGAGTTITQPWVFQSTDGLQTLSALSRLSQNGTDNAVLNSVTVNGTHIAAVLALNPGLNVTTVYTYSSNSGNSWNWPSISIPTQTKNQAADVVYWDGVQYIMSGLGWTGESTNLTSWTFVDNGANGLPVGYYGLQGFPNGAGLSGMSVNNGYGISGFGSTTTGLSWTLGPKFKGSAKDITYDSSASVLPAVEVQTAIELLSGEWGILQDQIFGD